jgi:predicted Fe-Mo cluster-binding NifX family protein
MLIAVASQNFRTVTPHAGKSRRFLVFKVAACRAPIEVDRLDLPKEQSMHEFKGDAAHPLDAMDVLIAGSVGAGLITRMADRGITAVATAETDPVIAIARYLAGTLARPATLDRVEQGCECRCS